MAQILELYLHHRYINGVAIGPGQCAVDDNGLIVPVAKLSIKELRAEVEARGVIGGEDMKKAELTAVVKVGFCRTLQDFAGPHMLLLLLSHVSFTCYTQYKGSWHLD